MNLKKTSILPRQKILQLVEEAKNAELCRDVEALEAIVEEFWDEPPRFDRYDAMDRAELVRIAGAYFAFFGFARNKKDYQIKGKDLLTEAIASFEASGEREKAAEAKVLLAHCYWNTGEVEESEALLEMVEAEFGENPAHPVFLRMQINRLSTLIWKKDFGGIQEIVENISPFIAASGDLRLKVKFHTDAGIFYLYAKQYDSALFHFGEAIEQSEKIGSSISVGLVLNNLAFLYKEIRQYPQAILHANTAIKKAEETANRGWKAHFLDTKALIFLDDNHAEAALDTIGEAIEIFREGEDAAGLSDALLTQVKCLLRLDQKEEALTAFAELLDIARSRIGEVAVKKFVQAISDEIYALKHISLPDEVQQFKKERVRAAIVQAKGKISEAAKHLGLKNHQALSDILNNQFPGLYGELGFRRRRTRRKERKGESRTVVVSSENILNEAKAAQVVLTGKNFAFAFPCPAEFKTFYLDRFMMKGLGIDSGAIVAVVAISKIKPGAHLLVYAGEELSLVRAEYDRLLRVFYFLDERGEPVPFDAEQVVGEPVGYCRVSDSEGRFIEFSPLG